MGGLITRSMIIKANDLGSDTFVEDVTTLGTPHMGASGAWACPNLQCQQIDKDSLYIALLKAWSSKKFPFHIARGGTDWTITGSEADGAGHQRPTSLPA